MHIVPPDAIKRLADEDVPCLKCGYNLRGLEPTGNCPECGSPVARSLQGNLLQFSSPDYVRRLHIGVVLILIANILAAAAWAGRIVVPLGLLTLNAGGLGSRVEQVLTFLEGPIDLLALLGWWMFSSPDPAIVGTDTGDQPRRFLRVAVIIALCVTVLRTIESAGGFSLGNVMRFIDGPLMLLAVAAWAMRFFAAMLYLRWLAPRIPNRTIAERAKLYMWLLPVIMVAGCLVFGIGYLVALVLFLILLDEVRRSIRFVRTRMDNDDTLTATA